MMNGLLVPVIICCIIILRFRQTSSRALIRGEYGDCNGDENSTNVPLRFISTASEHASARTKPSTISAIDVVVQLSLWRRDLNGNLEVIHDHQTVNVAWENWDDRDQVICLSQSSSYELSVHIYMSPSLQSKRDFVYEGAIVCGKYHSHWGETFVIDNEVKRICSNNDKTHEPSKYVVPGTTHRALTGEGVPTASPTKKPKPTRSPTNPPTSIPTSIPTSYPTAVPTPPPTSIPTSIPTSYPTPEPTSIPSASPTYGCDPTPMPSQQPTSQPTSQPSIPTSQPTSQPSTPTSQPSSQPSTPTKVPTLRPSARPSHQPSPSPSRAPTVPPTTAAPSSPSAAPTMPPSAEPTAAPTDPTATPTDAPTSPSPEPTPAPTVAPSRNSTVDGGVLNGRRGSGTAFVETSTGIGTIAGAGAVSLGLLAGVAYYFLKASQNLVKVPLAPAHMANIV